MDEFDRCGVDTEPRSAPREKCERDRVQREADLGEPVLVSDGVVLVSDPLEHAVPDEVRRYLRFRFSEIGWDDHLPFTEMQIQDLILDSAGLPGEIDRRASELLNGAANGAESSWFPPLHRAALTLLLVIVAMG